MFVIQPISRDSEVSLLESVLLSDTQLWKAARSAWHRLFIAGLLMDPDAKRDFATVSYRLIVLNWEMIKTVWQTDRYLRDTMDDWWAILFRMITIIHIAWHHYQSSCSRFRRLPSTWWAITKPWRPYCAAFLARLIVGRIRVTNGHLNAS